MNTQRIQKSPEAIRAEAAAWIARVHGSQRSPQLEAGLRRWLAEDPGNARVFERMTEAWEVASSVSSDHGTRMAVWRSVRSNVWPRAAVSFAMCGLAALAVFVWWGNASYSTGIGEQRSVRLEDGSRVLLNSASRVTVEYSDAGRRLVLKAGEAFFEVAADPRRPFVVVAGRREVKALGTSFSVRYESDRFDVVLVDGKVAVSTVTLSPGQRLSVRKSGMPQLDTPRLEVVTAWRRGEVVLDKTALIEAIGEMNRYDEARLEIDPQLAELLVSGVYRTGDNVGFARAIAEMYRLQVVQNGDRIRLRGTASAGS